MVAGKDHHDCEEARTSSSEDKARRGQGRNEKYFEVGRQNQHARTDG